MNSLNDFQIVVLLPLLTAGMTALGYDIYSWCKHTFGKKGVEIDENEKIAVCVILGMLFLFVNSLWFIPKVIVGNIAEEVVKIQDENCRNSTRKDGTELTEDQCEYFHDVMNGKYSSYDTEDDYEWLDRDPY